MEDQAGSPLSLVAGIPTYFLWAFLWVSLTETSAVLIGLAWAAFLFAFTYPATRARWGEVNGALASLLTALVAPVLAAAASVLFYLVLLIIAGGDPGKPQVSLVAWKADSDSRSEATRTSS